VLPIQWGDWRDRLPSPAVALPDTALVNPTRMAPLAPVPPAILATPRRLKLPACRRQAGNATWDPTTPRLKSTMSPSTE
jgi:hypothetical protein